MDILVDYVLFRKKVGSMPTLGKTALFAVETHVFGTLVQIKYIVCTTIQNDLFASAHLYEPMNAIPSD